MVQLINDIVKSLMFSYLLQKRYLWKKEASFWEAVSPKERLPTSFKWSSSPAAPFVTSKYSSLNTKLPVKRNKIWSYSAHSWALNQTELSCWYRSNTVNIVVISTKPREGICSENTVNKFPCLMQPANLYISFLQLLRGLSSIVIKGQHQKFFLENLG